MSAAYVAVDWGTSSFRAWLMAADGTALAESRGPQGMQYCVGAGFEPVLRAHLAKLGAHAALPVVMCGMVGARQGWAEAPYLHTPTALNALHEGAIRLPVDGDVRILPGVARADAAKPDVMRGEETQLLGVIESDHTGLVCIPGTHSKWIRLESGRLTGFTTYMTGELYALLAKHSILQHAVDPDGAPAVAGDAFRTAVAAALRAPESLTSALFGIRAAQLLGFEPKSDGAAWLSGRLIGTEIAAALDRRRDLTHVRLIGAGALSDLYVAALAQAGLRVTVVDAEHASRQGLAKAAKQLWGR